MQSRLESFVETLLNTLVGLLLNLGGQYVIFPILGIAVTHSEHLLITVFFTFLSIARGYGMRRFGQRWLTAAARRIA